VQLKPIHRNLQHVPKIWGLTYLKLFASLFSMLISIFIYFFAVSRGVMALVFSLGVLAGSLGISYYLDSRDPLENRKHSAFIREQVTAYSLSNQKIKIREEKTEKENEKIQPAVGRSA